MPARKCCEICGDTSEKKKENAHIIAGGVKGVNGCKCPPNMITACKFPCHRTHIHLKGWGWILARYAHLRERFHGAMLHYEARCRGETRCSSKSKVAQIARMRIANTRVLGRRVRPDPRTNTEIGG